MVPSSHTFPPLPSLPVSFPTGLGRSPAQPLPHSSASTCPYILMTINYCFCCKAIDTRLMQVGFGFLFFFKFLIKSKKQTVYFDQVISLSASSRREGEGPFRRDFEKEAFL